MNDSTDVGLVETHAECYGRNDDAELAGHEVILDVLACNARHASMVALSTPRTTFLLSCILLLGLGLGLAFTWKSYLTFVR